MKCERTGCTKEARWKPVLLLRVHLRHEPARGEMDLSVCDEHKMLLGPEDLIGNDEGWEQIQRTFARVGKAMPKRLFTTLEWIPIKGKD